MKRLGNTECILLSHWVTKERMQISSGEYDICDYEFNVSAWLKLIVGRAEPKCIHIYIYIDDYPR